MLFIVTQWDLLANTSLTCHRDDKGGIHGINVQGSGPGRQVEIGDKVGKLTEDQRPSVYAKERVLQQREIQYFGFSDSHLTWQTWMWGKSNNGGPIHTAIELCWAIWSCRFTLTQVRMGLMAIYSIQDQSGQFRIHWLVLESLSTLPPNVHGVPVRGWRGWKRVWFGDAIGYLSGAIQTVLGVLLLWGTLERNSRALLDGRRGRVWNRWLYIDGSQKHARGHQIQHETTKNQHGSYGWQRELRIENITSHGLYFYWHTDNQKCIPCQAYWSRSSWVKGASAKVKPIPERPIAYAVANLFRKYNAVTTEKDWYSSAKPIPERGKWCFH